MKLDPISSLFIIHFGSNVGYAIAPLERLFYRVGVELGGGDPGKVHFGFKNLAKGHPESLPHWFNNIIAYDMTDVSRPNMERLADYIRAHKIRLVVIFDINPVWPLFRRLRRAGATTLLGYYGAPVSSRMPLWKLGLKRLQIVLSRSKLDGLIFESHAMADLAVWGRGVPSSMIDIVPLGVDVSCFQPVRTDYAYRVLSIPKHKQIVIYSGHMERRKGVYVLVEAAIDLLAKRGRRDVCFLICGNRGEQSREYENMYAGLGIDGGIRFGGYRSDMAELYSSSFCGVIPSTGWDSFPRTSLEMAASGLPVIASRLQGLCEAVLDGETGLLFGPGNAKALADLIEMLLDKPELAARLGKGGRTRCERELNLEVQQNRFLKVIRKYLQACD